MTLEGLGIDDLHFHDLRHEVVSRLFELGTLNVMEVAAISGHKSMNMLKRYTHLRASHLVTKLHVRKRQAQKFSALFVPYPVDVVHAPEGISLWFRDLDNMCISGATKEDAISAASVALLRIQALAASRGARLPPPGNISVNAKDRLLISPLSSG